MYNKKNLLPLLFSLACIMVFGFAACKSDNTSANGDPTAYMVTYLVTDTGAEFPGARVDTNLVNGWGVGFNAGGNFVVASNGPGLALSYDKNGNQVMDPITIPARTGSGGTPNSVVINSNAAEFGGYTYLFSSEDGIISGWKSGSNAVTVATSKQPQGVYKGMVIAANGSAGDFIYATDFHNDRIDMYDKNFTAMNTDNLFKDSSMEQGFSPFGIVTFNGQIYVSYAVQKMPAKHDDQSGPGNGIIDVFTPDGKTLVRRFAAHGTLNSPWAMVMAPSTYGQFANDLLICNFGDGTINAYDPTTGNFLGQLKDANGNAIVIHGLWGANTQSGTFYFAAGPNDEAHGSFGTVKVK